MPMNAAIAERRLHNHYISRAARRQPAGIVEWLGAVQAQEYPHARWALALRMPEGTTDADIERAFDEGRLLRTHVMRPTWHFVTPSDIRWMLELTAPRVHRVMAPYNRRLELDASTLTRGAAIVERALRDGRFLTRTELGLRLARAGLPLTGQRLAHLALYAELEGVICSGPRRDKQFTYALLAERAPQARRLSGDEALAELTRRFFRSHGPATIRDFVWWSGLRTGDARRGLDMIRAKPHAHGGWTYWTIGAAPARAARRRAAHLLPVYDEYVVAYRDRDAVPHGRTTIAPGVRGLMIFQHAVVIDGQIAGAWRARRTPAGIAIDVVPSRHLTQPERRLLAAAAGRYARFLGVPAHEIREIGRS